ncbi:MAG: alanine dehydrogenase [Winogradskyella sp.]|nr:NAD(P)-dependent oxidoreductase [Winogradskyella sp.]NNC45585.1 alanine dehydrogenase [Winogradskyella sp.]NNF85765.1 alanine dehydrogenase [Winogradskyella sp.]NNK39830.1 alanine dehydrogenase [Winogradskyella sp.]NNL81830.1 alanine dehydrogenase [Winogradskyella sp.]
MKFAIIKERKNPPDRRVVLSPQACVAIKDQYPEAELLVESSDIRVFPDSAYSSLGFNVQEDVSEAEVMLGVKEVPINALIPNKKYFFFSHTIKKQPYNRELLRAILDKNIELYDHEVIVDKNNVRLIGFGYYAGVVGAYNGIRTLGLKHNLFNLPKASELKNRDELNLELDKISLPNIKIVLTGTGRVGSGAKEILDHLKIREVSAINYLNESYNEPVYVNIDALDYNERLDGKKLGLSDFFNNPEAYKSTFMSFAKVSDLFIAGHFYGDGAPFLFTREDAKSPDFKISVVADISCDIDGPVACTIKSSTIAEPNYGYDPVSETEVDFKDSKAIAVMAVDNLPCELPDNASRGFSFQFIENVIPAFFNGDKDGVLQRARMTKDGKLTDRFSYLQDYVDGKE